VTAVQTNSISSSLSFLRIPDAFSRQPFSEVPRQRTPFSTKTAMNEKKETKDNERSDGGGKDSNTNESSSTRDRMSFADMYTDHELSIYERIVEASWQRFVFLVSCAAALVTVVVMNWEDLRKQFTGEVAEVASSALGDRKLLDKSNELALAVAQHLLYDEKTQDALTSLVSEVLQNKKTRDELVVLFSDLFQDPIILEEVTKLSSEVTNRVLNDGEVNTHALKITAELFNKVLAEKHLQSQAGVALWNSIKYAIVPNWFGEYAGQPPPPTQQQQQQQQPSTKSPDESKSMGVASTKNEQGVAAETVVTGEKKKEGLPTFDENVAVAASARKSRDVNDDKEEEKGDTAAINTDSRNASKLGEIKNIDAYDDDDSLLLPDAAVANAFDRPWENDFVVDDYEPPQIDIHEDTEMAEKGSSISGGNSRHEQVPNHHPTDIDGSSSSSSSSSANAAKKKETLQRAEDLRLNRKMPEGDRGGDIASSSSSSSSSSSLSSSSDEKRGSKGKDGNDSKNGGDKASGGKGLDAERNTDIEGSDNDDGNGLSGGDVRGGNLRPDESGREGGLNLENIAYFK